MSRLQFCCAIQILVRAEVLRKVVQAFLFSFSSIATYGQRYELHSCGMNERETEWTELETLL